MAKNPRLRAVVEESAARKRLDALYAEWYPVISDWLVAKLRGPRVGGPGSIWDKSVNIWKRRPLKHASKKKVNRKSIRTHV